MLKIVLTFSENTRTLRRICMLMVTWYQRLPLSNSFRLFQFHSGSYFNYFTHVRHQPTMAALLNSWEHRPMH